MNLPVEDLTSSLVREFLHKKKCLQTLKLLDEEWPRTESSLSSRAKLAEALHIEDWVLKNKMTKPKFKTMLEIILHNIVQLNKTTQENDATVNPSLFNRDLPPRPYTADSNIGHIHKGSSEAKFKPAAAFQDIDESELDILTMPNTNNFVKSREINQHIQSNAFKNSVPGDGSMFDKNKSRQSLSDIPSNTHSPSIEEILSISPKRSTLTNSIPLRVESESNSFFSAKFAEDRRTSIPEKEVIQSSENIFSYEVAKNLRKLIFGSSKLGFTPEWTDQSFSFFDCNDRPKKLRYGIKQKKGGPCGVLASVQATVLKHLLFFNGAKLQTESCLNVSDEKRTKCLIETITEMIWRSGQSSQATLAIMTPRKQFTGISGEYRPDGVTEYVSTLSFTVKVDLHSAVAEHIQSFESGKGSCILLLYSAILSHSIDSVKEDMDEPMGKLMGAHNYCTQEMINLLLTGFATSNAFDNIIQLDKLTTLKGIKSQSEVGLLSLFEHYGSCKIGSFFKAPKYPIWLVCSESHFTVLFSLDLNLISKFSSATIFDLYYYDGLANQDEVIKLTVNTTATVSNEYIRKDLVPPLEHCIRTKWSKASIDWNDTEPLL